MDLMQQDFIEQWHQIYVGVIDKFGQIIESPCEFWDNVRIYRRSALKGGFDAIL